jgi:hypothetical protein
MEQALATTTLRSHVQDLNEHIARLHQKLSNNKVYDEADEK